ncbi:tetratricopeptide repeat protein [Sphingobacterium bovistauri]|uniref:Tetratricopeptide repeat protein n=1 Tax=Sphingobacterium bovistauri TaxID=2781959 RepID=A0ABS7Z624_9SPHI|nr:tetratricopeptide repeat protein [Sphingobacterium bovistauri]MCA5005614.1 tetratricopeptide repeat protein [Sphingobacterium bovistauri]
MNRIKQLEEFLQESPQDPFLHYALTMEYLKGEDITKTKAGFENLINNFPDYVGSYYHYGKFLEKQGDVAQAEHVYKLGIQVAVEKRNHHAKSELLGALNLLMGFDDDDDC